jgi:hypothetical protein
MLRDSGDFRQSSARTTPSCNRTTRHMSRAAISCSAALLLCCATTYAQPTLREDHTTRDLRTSPIPAAGEKIPVRDVDALPAWLWRQPGMPSTMLSSPQGIALLADQGTSYARQVFATCDLRTRPVTRMAYSMRAEALALAGDFTAAIQALDELVQKADSFDRESAISQLITREALVYHTLIAADESTRRAQFTTSLTAALTTWLNSKERSAIASGLKRENENNDLNMTKPEQLGWYLENARTWSPLSLKSLAEVNVDWSVDFVRPDMSPREARQLLDRLAPHPEGDEQCRQLGRRRLPVHHGAHRGPGLVARQRRQRHAPRFAAAVVARLMDRDAQQPGAQRGAPREAFEAPEKGDPDLLHGVVPRGARVAVPLHGAHHRRAVGLDEALERRLVPRAQGIDQRAVAVTDGSMPHRSR